MAIGMNDPWADYGSMSNEELAAALGVDPKDLAKAMDNGMTIDYPMDGTTMMPPMDGTTMMPPMDGTTMMPDWAPPTTVLAQLT
jgi:hypothetical protein